MWKGLWNVFLNPQELRELGNLPNSRPEMLLGDFEGIEETLKGIQNEAIFHPKSTFLHWFAYVLQVSGGVIVIKVSLVVSQIKTCPYTVSNENITHFLWTQLSKK